MDPVGGVHDNTTVGCTEKQSVDELVSRADELVLEPTAKPFGKLLATCTRELQPSAGGEQNGVVAVGERYQFADSIDVHDSRSMNAHELSLWKLRDECGDRGEMQVGASPGVDAHVVAVALNPVDRRWLERDDAPAVANDDAGDLIRRPRRESNARSVHGARELRVVDGLQQVVER